MGLFRDAADAIKALRGLERMSGPVTLIGAGGPLTVTPNNSPPPYPSGSTTGDGSGLTAGSGWVGRYVRDADGFWRFEPTNATAAGQINALVSSVFAICLGSITDNFPQAKGEAKQEQKDGTLMPLPDHPLTKILRRPSQAFSSAQTWQRVLTDYFVIGQGYLVIMRDQTGTPAGLFPVPAALLAPRWPTDGTEWISHYDYYPFGYSGPVYRLEVGDVIQFTNGCNQSSFSQGRLGNPITEVIASELGLDTTAGSFVESILKNMGLPGVVMSPREGVTSLSKEQTDAMVEAYQNRVSGRNVGRAVYFNAALRLDQIGFNPEQMTLLSLRHLAEERIAAAFGVPLLVAGFGARDASSYNNQKVAYRQFWLTCLDPLLREFAEEIETNLGPQFPETPGLRVVFDRDGVWAMQEDQELVEKREIAKWEAGLCTRAEARMALGYDPGPEYYKLEPGMVIIPEDADVQEVQNLLGTGGQSALPEELQPAPPQMLLNAAPSGASGLAPEGAQQDQGAPLAEQGVGATKTTALTGEMIDAVARAYWRRVAPVGIRGLISAAVEEEPPEGEL